VEKIQELKPEGIILSGGQPASTRKTRRKSMKRFSGAGAFSRTATAWRLNLALVASRPADRREYGPPT